MNKKGQEATTILWTIGILVLLVGLVCLWGISIVKYNEFAYEREFGILKPELKEQGFNWIGFGQLERVNNQIRNYEIVVEGASEDYQDVKMVLNLNIKIKKEVVYDYLKEYQSEEQFRQYLNNKVQEKVKTIILKYSAEEVLLKRLEISEEMFLAIKEIPEIKYFNVNDINIKDIQFSDKFTDILERKAQVLIEREVLTRQEENLKLLNKNMMIVDVNTYFKYQLIEKWDGKSNLIISDAILR